MAHSKPRTYRRRLAVTVPAGHADVVAALGELRDQSPSQVDWVSAYKRYVG